MSLQRLCTSCCIGVLVALPLTAGGQVAASTTRPITVPGPGYVELAAFRGRHIAMPAALVRHVTLRHTGIPLELALVEIARQAGLGLAYGRDLTVAERVSNTVVEDLPAADAFEKLLDGTPWTIYISPTGQAIVAQRPPPSTVGAIVGHVTDAKTGLPIAYAAVLIDNSHDEVTANDSGSYRIKNVATGTHTVAARRLGYLAISQTITVTAGQTVAADFALQKSTSQLDEVVVTGTVTPTEVKAVPNPITVITADQLQQQDVTNLDQVFRGTVPGSTAWDEGVNDFQSEISIRGRNSFQGDAPKVYVDGIEMDNAAFLPAIDPSSVDHMEVIRGPEGSTIYGSDASGGVIQIFTKTGALGLAHPEVDGQVSAGGIQSQYRSGEAARQDYGIAVRGGSNDVSYNVGGSYASSDPWVPGYQSRDIGIYGGARGTVGPVSFTLTSRYNSKRFDPVYDPALDVYTYYSKPLYEVDNLPTQTYGLHMTYAATSWWTNNLTAGVDLSEYQYYNTRPRLTTPDDTLIDYVNTINGSKALIAYNTAVTMPAIGGVVPTITAGVDHWTEQSQYAFAFNATNNEGNINAEGAATGRIVTNNTGEFGQLQLNVRNDLFLTAGLRADQNSNFGSSRESVLEPRYGASYVIHAGGVQVKLRASYGRGIRAPLPTEQTALPVAGQLANPALLPEELIGGDGGIDVYLFNSRLSFSTTYYNQNAVNLINSVLVDASTTPQEDQYQNVGRVHNTGVEFEIGATPISSIRLTAQYSIINSRVDVAGGGYEVGDTPFDTPRASAGGTITWTPLSRTSISGTLTYIGSWIDYDNLALDASTDGYGTVPARPSLRDYWIKYPAFAKLNLNVSQYVGAGLTAFVAVKNVTNSHAVEQNNTNVVPGRISMAGLRFHY